MNDQIFNELDKKRKGPEQKRGSAVFAVCLLLVFVFICSGCSFRNDTRETPTEEKAAVLSAAPETEATEAPKELSFTDLLKAVMTVKDDLEAVFDELEDGKPESAQTILNGVGEKTEIIRRSIIASMEALGDKMPSLQTQLGNIQKILDLVDLASERVLMPVIGQLQEYPLSLMKADDGINTPVLCTYLDFAAELMPEVEKLEALAKEIDLNVIDSEEKVERYLEMVDTFLEIYHADENIFSRLKSVLGADGDRVYVIAAQNSAEVRASGGFPGAVGTVSIKNGVFTVGEFRKVYDVFSAYTPEQAHVTSKEYYLFAAGLSAPRDADYCPDFERVAEIFALGYETGMGEHANGVISMTPVLVQRILAAMDEEIVLFDDTVLNGDNAVNGLQHDLYFRYFGAGYGNVNATLADQVFADAAKKLAQKVMEHLSMKDIAAYLEVAMESFADRTLMLWSDDSAEQALIEKMGWSGGLNKDPQQPQVGVYFNTNVASKMGLFLSVDTEVGDRVRNEDGSYSYPVTVTFSNTMTKEELDAAGGYITGWRNGGFGGMAYFFAPAGGDVSDFKTDNGTELFLDEYHDLRLGFIPSLMIFPGQPLTVSFSVTTAPGVETELTVSQTPTLQEYR